MVNEQMNYELGTARGRIEELERELAAERKYEQNILKNLQSGMDLDMPLSEVPGFPMRQKFELVRMFYRYSKEDFTLCTLLHISRNEYLQVPGFGQQTMRKFQEWLDKNKLTLI